MGNLPPETLHTVPHVTFSIFNLAVPNIIAWSIIVVIFVVAAFLRLPRIFESDSS